MKTGFKKLDKILKLNKGELIFVASRPAMGKTTFVVNILNHIAIKENKSCLMFSLEENKEKIVKRMIISNSMVENEKLNLYDENQMLNKGLSNEDWDRITYGVNLLKNAPIYISSSTPYSINDICVESRKMKIEKNIEVIIIDYLQLIQNDKDRLLSRDNEIENILKKLKELAKTLDVPIIITSQLSRKCEDRENKRPEINDFTNSRYAILTYSDKIIFIYRNSYYNKKIQNNIAEIIIAKNRSGNIATVKLAYMPEYYKFGNLFVMES